MWINCDSSVDSDTILNNQKKPELIDEYRTIRLSYEHKNSHFNPTVLCSDMEGVMYSWIGFQKYVWMKEETIDGMVYPKIAVKKGKNEDCSIVFSVCCKLYLNNLLLLRLHLIFMYLTEFV